MNTWVIAIVAFLFFDFVLVAWIFFWKRRPNKLNDKELTYIRSHWIRIIDSFHAHPRNAVLDADKLLDYALGKQGLVGSVGEKLKKGGHLFSDLNGVWGAHKLRNQVAHELGDIDSIAAKNALQQFKKALNDLGAKL